MHARDTADLAALHVACLPDSIVGALGIAYVRSFYRYVTRSERELVVVERNHDGRIVAAAVVSLDPATLTRRLLWHSALLPSALLHAPRVLGTLWPGLRRRDVAAATPPYQPSGAPEMILTFTAADLRGRGLGSALLRQADRGLRQRGVRSYEVRTVLDESNPALAFYQRRGCLPCGTVVRLGVLFQVFTRPLDTDPDEA